jgi:hypothetical protein
MDSQFEWTIPSEKKLNYILGRKIKNIIKCSYERYQDYLDYLNLIKRKDNHDIKSFFKYSYGSVLVIFDDESEYLFSSADDLNSVILCCQKQDHIYKSDYILNDTDVLEKITVFDIPDNYDFISLIDKVITQVNILSVSDMNYKEQGVSSEKGLEFIFDNNDKLLFSHNLTEDNFVFSILTDKDHVTSRINVIKSYK